MIMSSKYDDNFGNSFINVIYLQLFSAKKRLLNEINNICMHEYLMKEKIRYINQNLRTTVFQSSYKKNSNNFCSYE